MNYLPLAPSRAIYQEPGYATGYQLNRKMDQSSRLAYWGRIIAQQIINRRRGAVRAVFRRRTFKISQVRIGELPPLRSHPESMKFKQSWRASVLFSPHFLRERRTFDYHIKLKSRAII